MIPVKRIMRVQRGEGKWGRPGPGVRSFPPGGREVRTVVETIKVELAGEVPLGVMDEGDDEQVESAGRPLQLSVTAELNPPKGVTVTVTSPALPATTVAEVGLTARAKSKLVPPTPTSATVCGLLAALSVKTRVAVRVPAAWGVKTTLTVQEPPLAATVGPHELAPKLKSPPMMLTPVRVSTAVPLLEIVTVCGALALPSA